MFAIGLCRSAALTVAVALAAGSLAATAAGAAPTETKPAYFTGGDYMPPVFSGAKTPRRVAVEQSQPRPAATKSVRPRVTQVAMKAPAAKAETLAKPAAEVRPVASSGTMALESRALDAKALNGKTLGEMKTTADTATTIPAAGETPLAEGTSPAAEPLTNEPKRLLVDEKPITKARLADGTIPTGEVCSRFDAMTGKPMTILCR